MGLVQGQASESCLLANLRYMHTRTCTPYRQRQSLLQVRLCSALAVLPGVTLQWDQPTRTDYCRREDAVGQEQERVRVASLCCLAQRCSGASSCLRLCLRLPGVSPPTARARLRRDRYCWLAVGTKARKLIYRSWVACCWRALPVVAVFWIFPPSTLFGRPCYCCLLSHTYHHSHNNLAGPPPSCLRSPTYTVESTLV